MASKHILKLAVFSLFILGSSACFDSGKISSRPSNATMTTNKTLYDFTVNSLEGEPVSLSQYKGKKVVILNVASKCGYTPQYADWQAFFEANKEDLVVLGFPCNDFLSQEPGSAEEIASFCEKNYGVTFPMFEKVHVKGDEQAPLYSWLSDPKQNGWNSDVPSWNFCKYLIDENGALTHFFASAVKPDSPEFMKALGL
jgi:glutathione peroxidase